mgnify:CR=1 FL=1
MICVVEDDPNIREIEVYAMKDCHMETKEASCAKEFWKLCENEVPELVLLDIMLPDEDGLSIWRKLRGTAATQKLPVMMLTAKGTEYDKVIGLDSGADDYLPKPFVMAELLARVRALTRRQGEYRHSTLRFGDLVLSRTDFNLSAPRGTVRLVGKEFQICELFLSNPRQLLSPEQLLTKIWGYDTDVEINVVWVNISNLRKKFAEIGAHVSIRSVRGAGYILDETL